MKPAHQIRIEARKTLVDGQIVHEFFLTEWDEDAVYGSIRMSETQARTVGKVLRKVSAPDPRLSRRALRAFLENPVALVYHVIRAFWMPPRGEE